MSLFYSDDTILDFERRLDYSSVIEHLENLYRTTHDTQIFVTLIASAWYYLVEGDTNQQPLNYHWEYFHSKLKYYLDIGLRDYTSDERFDYVAGYLLDLHWMYLGASYEGIGLELMRKCSEISEDERIKALALSFLKNDKLSNPETVVKMLFPSNSELDTYFSYVIGCDSQKQ